MMMLESREKVIVDLEENLHLLPNGPKTNRIIVPLRNLTQLGPGGHICVYLVGALLKNL